MWGVTLSCGFIELQYNYILFLESLYNFYVIQYSSQLDFKRIYFFFKFIIDRTKTLKNK